MLVVGEGPGFGDAASPLVAPVVGREEPELMGGVVGVRIRHHQLPESGGAVGCGAIQEVADAFLGRCLDPARSAENHALIVPAHKTDVAALYDRWLRQESITPMIEGVQLPGYGDRPAGRDGLLFACLHVRVWVPCWCWFRSTCHDAGGHANVCQAISGHIVAETSRDGRGSRHPCLAVGTGHRVGRDRRDRDRRRRRVAAIVVVEALRIGVGFPQGTQRGPGIVVACR